MDYRLEILLKGHILNPFWHSRMDRRSRRGEVTAAAVERYLSKYISFIQNLKPPGPSPDGASSPCGSPSHPYDPKDLCEPSDPQDPCCPCANRIFSIWLQGEAKAPAVAQACWRSVRANCPETLVILDADSLDKWIELPDYVQQKYRRGAMRPAHYADICRLALLVKYGGLWLDATDFVPQAFPQWLWNCEFFIHMSGKRLFGWYSHVQNCFIRASRGNFLIRAWYELVLEYWRHEDKVADYFVHQLLFKMLVTHNELARKEFEAMPKVCQDPTHEIWFGHGNDAFDSVSWEKMASAALFQKTEYKSKMSSAPIPGSNAEHLILSYPE